MVKRRRRIATAPTPLSPPAFGQDAASMSIAVETLSAMLSVSSTSEQDAITGPKSDMEREDFPLLRNTVNNLPAVTPTSHPSDQDLGRALMRNAGETSLVAMLMPLPAEQDIESEGVPPLRDVTEIPSDVTPTPLVSKQDLVRDGAPLEVEAVEMPPVATPVPPATEQDVEREGTPLKSKAIEKLRAISEADASQYGKKKDSKTWSEALQLERRLNSGRKALSRMKNFVYDRITPAEVVRQLTNGYSIKFIIVIGLTGVGKSSIVKILTDSDVHIGHSIDAGTTTFAMFPTIIDDQRYILIDTPGFNDKKRTDLEIFQEILDWFKMITPYCDLSGILYVHDMRHQRIDGVSLLNLEMLQALCGKQFYKNVTIVTTMWSEMSKLAIKRAKKRQEEFEKDPWKELIEGGARVFKHEYGFAEPEQQSDEPDSSDQEADYAEQVEEALNSLCDMMIYYKTSENVQPTIQMELRRRVQILETEAGKVLNKYNVTSTTAQVNGESSGVSQSPILSQAITEVRATPSRATQAPHDRQPRRPAVVVREGPPPRFPASIPSPVNRQAADGRFQPPETTAQTLVPEEEDEVEEDDEEEEEEEEEADYDEYQGGHEGESSSDEEDEKEESGKSGGWFRNMIRAIKWFFGF